jgi:hypothetical protein
MVSAQYILIKSLCRPAFCASEDTDRTRAKSEIENLQWSHEYAEPGYTHPGKGILFANWNYFAREATDLLERAGYAIEWSDEWATCQDCDKAVRTSPDSYGWTRSYHIFNECELLCCDCIREDPTSYLEDITDNPHKALFPSFNIDPTNHEYKLIETDFENGMHPGQTDDPRKIYERLTKDGHKSILFAVDSVGQFDVSFSVYAREDEA